MIKRDEIEKLFSQVKEISLDNGFKIIYYENSSFDKYYFEMTTKYGAIDFSYEKSDKIINHNPGIAHFLEHVMFNMPYGDGLLEFNKYLGSANAYTSFDRTTYLVQTSKNVQDNLKTLLDLVTTFYVDEQKVEKEKGIIVEEIGMYDKNPDWNIFKNTLRNSFEKGKYQHDILGSKEDVEGITLEMLQEVFADFYCPQNQYIVMVGPNILEYVKYVEKYMSKFENTSNVKTYYYEEEKQIKNNRFIEEDDVFQKYVSLSYKYVSDDIVDTFKNSLYIELYLELLYTNFSKKYIEAENKQIIDYSFEFDSLVHTNTILIMFFGINQDLNKLRDFIKNSDNTKINVEQLIHQKIGKLFRSFDNEVVLGRFLNRLYVRDISPKMYYEYLTAFNVEKINELLNSRSKSELINEIIEVQGE